MESVETSYGLFHAVAFEAAKGEQREVEELTDEQFIDWGKALGNLHNASSEISVPERPTWPDHLSMVADILPDSEEAALTTLAQLQRELEQLEVNKQNFGLIHYDFELYNLIWQGKEAAIIDFDDSAAYWFVADIALALGDLFDGSTDATNLQNPSFLQFIRGYRSARPISDEELRLIPLFLRLDNLITFAKLHRALTPINPAGELSWMPDLRSKLEAKMRLCQGEFSSEVTY